MLEKTIAYTDFRGHDRSETFNFNLTQSELSEFAYSEDGGLDVVLKRIIDTRDTKNLMKYFKKLILMSYGVISDDGRRFIKSDELSKAFSESPAYDILFNELLGDADKAIEFIKSCMPQDLRDKVDSAKMDEIKAKANISALPAVNANS